jgi:hypothetical protein
MRSMFLVVAIAGAASLFGASGAKAEIIYPWCAQYSGGPEGSNGTNCGFVTHQQCWDTVAGGRIGDCYQNPMYQGAAVPQAPHRKRHRHVDPG